MCVTCGCNQKDGVRVEGEAHGEHVHILPDGTRIVHAHEDHQLHDHALMLLHPHAPHDHPHDRSVDPRAAAARTHTHGHDALRGGREGDAELIHLERSLLDKNQRIAERNRGWFAGRGVFALNLMSSPGAGKTSLLVRTLAELRGEIPMSVVEGDQETSADAQRIRATGAKAVQVNTGAGCHLEADMLERAIGVLSPPPDSLLFVENVGNLVCPALFDLGEGARVVVLSVTEGDDKPLKYPHMFRAAELMVLTKTDLLPHVDFDPDAAEAAARAVNPGIRSLRLSSRSGEGMAAWYGWLRGELAARSRQGSQPA